MQKERTVARGGQMVASSLPARRWDGRLSNSARTSFWNCRQKFDWEYLRRLSPRAVNVPFLVGGLFHDELEIMYRAREFDEEKCRQRVTRRVERACMREGMTTEQSDKVWVQRAMVMGMVRGYVELYLKEDLKRWRILECEKKFGFPLPGKDKQFVGKRDMLVREVKKPGRVLLVEHKTTSRLDAGYVAKLPLDSQILGYALSVKKETGKAPQGIVYNVAKKSQLRQRGTDSFQQYAARVESEFLSNPNGYFYRETISFSEQDLRNFETELRRFSKEMLRAVEEGYFYKNTTHCTAYGVCPYMRLCIDGATSENLVFYQERKHTHAELDGDEEE